MRHRTASLLALAPLLLAVQGLPAAEKPTPTPKTTKKLGGGSFGQPPSLTPTPGAGGGSSLADIAKRAQVEGAAPAQKSTRRIVITNETLRRPEPTPVGASISITGSAGSKPVVRMPPEPTPTDEPPPEYKDASGRTEADWRQRASAARERVDRVQAELATAQDEARRLENDFYAWSDGNYRERVIRPAWDQARERVKLLEEEVVKAREDLESLEDDARKSGTPPGWLR